MKHRDPAVMPRRRKHKRNNARSCHGKVRFRDHAEATAALHRLSTDSTRQVVQKRVYECHLCHGGWHLTSQEER